jgi:predicted DNA-binding transcriptional regulator YafY
MVVGWNLTIGRRSQRPDGPEKLSRTGSAATTQPVTAAALAEELEVSKRTVYRDVSDMVGQRVPIEGSAGFGYLLASEYDMPPLMLTRDEIEAVVLGAQWVAGHSDKVLSNAARDVVAKIATVVPENLRPYII